jgi:hypothetical protein
MPTVGRDVLNQIPGADAAKNYIADVKAGNTPGAIGDVVGGVSSIAPMLLGDEATATKVSGCGQRRDRSNFRCCGEGKAARV